MTRTMVSAILLGIAALGGVFLASRRLGEKPLPWAVALLHGIAAASGVVLLFTFVFTFVVDLVSVAGTKAIAGLIPLALALLIGASLGGLVLASYHARSLPLPRGLMYAHALVALLGYACLLLGVVTGM